MRSPLRILIAPDKFKGTLPAAAAAAAIARGWRKRRPQDWLDVLPITDGGDGFGMVMQGLFNARQQFAGSVDAAHRPCRVAWWWEPKTKTAIIESAEVIGLAKLQAPEAQRSGSAPSRGQIRAAQALCVTAGQFHPFELDTFGLGLLLQAAAAKGARRCLVGLGGSATNDAGFGLARALGWVFFGRAGRALGHWTELRDLARVHRPKRRRWFRELVVAADVSNPLLGPRGATRVYGPQKGFRVEDLTRAERCLRRLALAMREDCGRDFAREPGAGAAGGLGFGLRTFLGARLEPGFDLFARQAGLRRRLNHADLVITGEGAIDDSTFMGKGVGRIAGLCRTAAIPCFGLAGVLQGRGVRHKLFTRLLALAEMTSLEQAQAQPAFWLQRLAERAAAELEEAAH